MTSLTHSIWALPPGTGASMSSSLFTGLCNGGLRPGSLQFQPALADHVIPAGVFVLQNLGELGRARSDAAVAHGVEALGDLLGGKSLGDLGLEPIDDLLWRAGGCEQAVPLRHVEVGVA